MKYCYTSGDCLITFIPNKDNFRLWCIDTSNTHNFSIEQSFGCYENIEITMRYALDNDLLIITKGLLMSITFIHDIKPITLYLNRIAISPVLYANITEICKLAKMIKENDKKLLKNKTFLEGLESEHMM